RPAQHPLQTCFIPQLFFHTPPTNTHLYTLSLHDALPIWGNTRTSGENAVQIPSSFATALAIDPHERLVLHAGDKIVAGDVVAVPDRKSTRLNSSHVKISYAVFCLKKKNTIRYQNGANLTH